MLMNCIIILSQIYINGLCVFKLPTCCAAQLYIYMLLGYMPYSQVLLLSCIYYTKFMLLRCMLHSQVVFLPLSYLYILHHALI